MGEEYEDESDVDIIDKKGGLYKKDKSKEGSKIRRRSFTLLLFMNDLLMIEY